MNDLRWFVYGPLMDPGLLTQAVPQARFERIAHLPAHRLAFSPAGTPVVVPDEGHTVWGGVFHVTSDDVASLTTGHPHGTTATTEWAVDREGDRFEVLVFSGEDGGKAGEEIVTHMVRGARHWELPAGWVVGLEDLIDPFQF